MNSIKQIFLVIICIDIVRSYIASSINLFIVVDVSSRFDKYDIS